ncbi:hypothetical protein PAMC26510_00760 [Caballeronia sordidicola]|uniref:Uncharacterized protein n=1 Tax=Caballeronia sordidicola TaxID=196367 RepID=A0A242NAR8_CABSO|nr:hypothetical protein PAMC26510_00760 [Caballeronia sordidicola]
MRHRTLHVTAPAFARYCQQNVENLRPLNLSKAQTFYNVD